jgi:hypothetical protein
MNNELWGVWAKVWGGTTRSSEAWLKENNQEWQGSEEEARRKAAQLMTRKSPHSKASFCYSALRRITK